MEVEHRLLVQPDSFSPGPGPPAETTNEHGTASPKIALQGSATQSSQSYTLLSYARDLAVKTLTSVAGSLLDESPDGTGPACGCFYYHQVHACGCPDSRSGDDAHGKDGLILPAPILDQRDCPYCQDARTRTLHTRGGWRFAPPPGAAVVSVLPFPCFAHLDAVSVTLSREAVEARIHHHHHDRNAPASAPAPPPPENFIRAEHAIDMQAFDEATCLPQEKFLLARYPSAWRRFANPFWQPLRAAFDVPRHDGYARGARVLDPAACAAAFELRWRAHADVLALVCGEADGNNLRVRRRDERARFWSME